jgi:hypothetical protein
VAGKWAPIAAISLQYPTSLHRRRARSGSPRGPASSGIPGTGVAQQNGRGSTVTGSASAPVAWRAGRWEVAVGTGVDQRWLGERADRRVSDAAASASAERRDRATGIGRCSSRSLRVPQRSLRVEVRLRRQSRRLPVPADRGRCVATAASERRPVGGDPDNAPALRDERPSPRGFVFIRGQWDHGSGNGRPALGGPTLTTSGLVAGSAQRPVGMDRRMGAVPPVANQATCADQRQVQARPGAWAYGYHRWIEASTSGWPGQRFRAREQRHVPHQWVRRGHYESERPLGAAGRAASPPPPPSYGGGRVEHRRPAGQGSIEAGFVWARGHYEWKNAYEWIGGHWGAARLQMSRRALGPAQ